MKKPLSLLFLILFFGFAANAKIYYVSNSGNDNNSGTSTSSPWKTLAKVSSFTGFAAGDQILFSRGQVFYGKLIVNNSGTSGNPITFGAYGSGANPVISGFTNVTSWVNLGGNIWESSGAISTLSATNMVSVNGANTPMGRYPNSGWLTYQSFSRNTSITSSSLSGSPNWTGAEAVIRKQRWIIDRNKITAQSGGTLTYSPSSSYNGQSGYGFFIQNDSRTLDVTNEWYFNPSTKKIRIYNTTTPTNVRVATIDTLVYMRFRNYITFDNLSIQGSNKDAFVILSSSNVTIQNCNIDYSGYDAIWGNQNNGQSSGNFVLKNTTINHTNNNAINLANEFTAPLITNNIIKNTGVVVGVGGSGDGMSIAIQTHCNDAKIQYNQVDSTGYMGVLFYNNNAIISNNLINHFCMVKLDGAGIYTWVGKNGTPYTGQKVLNNIVLNGMGNNSGTTATGSPISHGIYIDDWVANVEVAGNSVAYCSHAGIYLHNSHNINIHNNTSYGSGTYQILFASFDAGSPIRNDIVKNNLFISVSSLVGSFETSVNDISQFGTLDSNYWARPLNDNLTIQNDVNNYTSFTTRSLSQWQTYSGQDAHSKKSPKSITSVNDIRFEYNASTSSKTINLGANYIDIKNVAYNGSITLAPYTSAVLIYNGASTSNQPPVANAGPDQSITLPTSSVNLSGSGTDPNGTISAYNWTKISGPSGGIINSSTTAATTVSSLVQGIYKFQLKVTDNASASDVDTVQVTVNGATTSTSSSTLLPAVNPGTVVHGINYSYYESNTAYSALPNFSTLTPVKKGTLTNISISVANRSLQMSLNFTGYIYVPYDAQYTFYTNSDDGSKLYIDNVLVVNNDGLHSATEKSGVIGLKAGLHAISVGFFNQGGSGSLVVSYSSSVIPKQPLQSSTLFVLSSTAASVYGADMSISQNITSINQFAVKAYPNPFVNTITVTINGDAGDYKLILVDASGRVVWTRIGTKYQGTFEQSINVSLLPRGFYFLRLTQNNNSSVIKLEK